MSQKLEFKKTEEKEFWTDLVIYLISLVTHVWMLISDNKLSKKKNNIISLINIINYFHHSNYSA